MMEEMAGVAVSKERERERQQRCRYCSLLFMEASFHHVDRDAYKHISGKGEREADGHIHICRSGISFSMDA